MSTSQPVWNLNQDITKGKMNPAVPLNDATHCMTQGQRFRSEIESGTVSKKNLEISNDNMISMPSSMDSKRSESAAKT